MRGTEAEARERAPGGRAKSSVDTPRQVAAPSWSPQPQARTLTLPEQIALSIGNAIIAGTYQAGTRIMEQQLASDFQVSRGPVREALRILERDGLVQLQSRRGAQVTQFDADELKQIFQVRAALLGLAARLATMAQDLGFLFELKGGVEELAALARSDNAPGDYVVAVTRMNLALATASGNKYLKNIIFSLAHQTVRYTRLGLATRARRLQSAKNWKRLLKAVESKDPAEAAAVAESLVLDSRDAALALIASETVETPRASEPKARPAGHNRRAAR